MNRILGIDIGGTKIVSLELANRKIGRVTTCPTPGRKGFLLLLADLAQRARHSNIKKIGLAVAGAVSGTKLKSGANIHQLANIDFGAIFTGLKVIVINDAQAWAIAEGRLGTGRGYSKVLVFTIGTGIGRGVFYKNKPVKSAGFERAEKWEGKYQKIRDHHNWSQLAAFLGNKLSVIVRRHRPSVVVLSGGVLKAESGKFYFRLKQAIQRGGCNAVIKKSHFSNQGAAVGAALLLD